MDLEMVSKGRDYPSEISSDPWSETVSRLNLSSKSLPGVLEDLEVPDGPGDGV